MGLLLFILFVIMGLAVSPWFFAGALALILVNVMAA